ncbi:MAG: carboxypeptidase-like regulatory domain-containing protein [Hymenobacter sp.]
MPYPRGGYPSHPTIMKYLLSLLLTCLLATGAATAQTAPDSLAPAALPCPAYSGRIVSGEKQMAGISVAVKGSKIIVITNQEGFFALPPKLTEPPKLLISAAGYKAQEVKLTSCALATIEMEILPGTRIKKRGKKKGFIMQQGY